MKYEKNRTIRIISFIFLVGFLTVGFTTNNRGHDYMDVGGRITSGTVIETTFYLKASPRDDN
jgi:hypothetical protein